MNIEKPKRPDGRFLNISAIPGKNIWTTFSHPSPPKSTAGNRPPTGSGARGELRQASADASGGGWGKYGNAVLATTDGQTEAVCPPGSERKQADAG